MPTPHTRTTCPDCGQAHHTRAITTGDKLDQVTTPWTDNPEHCTIHI